MRDIIHKASPHPTTVPVILLILSFITLIAFTFCCQQENTVAAYGEAATISTPATESPARTTDSPYITTVSKIVTGLLILGVIGTGGLVFIVLTEERRNKGGQADA